MSNPLAQFAWVATLLVGLCFVADLISTRVAFSKTLAAAFLLWLLYACYETSYIDYPRVNIRVDLFLIVPLLAITTALGLLRWLNE